MVCTLNTQQFYRMQCHTIKALIMHYGSLLVAVEYLCEICRLKATITRFAYRPSIPFVFLSLQLHLHKTERVEHLYQTFRPVVGQFAYNKVNDHPSPNQWNTRTSHSR